MQLLPAVNMEAYWACCRQCMGKHQPWCWGTDQVTAFQKVKSQLTLEVLLVHFDPSKKIALSCDASSYGINWNGFITLAGRWADRPIAYTTCMVFGTCRKELFTNRKERFGCSAGN